MIVSYNFYQWISSSTTLKESRNEKNKSNYFGTIHFTSICKCSALGSICKCTVKGPKRCSRRDGTTEKKPNRRVDNKGKHSNKQNDSKEKSKLVRNKV